MIMSNKEEYEKKINDLFDRWKKDRNYGENFVKDGIQVFEVWEKTHPKICFLLKENWGTGNDMTGEFWIEYAKNKTFSKIFQDGKMQFKNFTIKEDKDLYFKVKNYLTQLMI